MSAKGSLVFIFVLAVMLACILLNTGCATAYLQNKCVAKMQANGFTRSAYNKDIMVNEALPLGSRAVDLAEVANQENPILYKLAWVFDYVLVPSAAGFGLYKGAQQLDGGGQGDTYNYNTGGGDVVHQSGSGNQSEQSQSTEVAK